MVRTRSTVGGEGDIDWAKFLYDDGGELTAEEVSVIPKNIVSERKKRLESLFGKSVPSGENELKETSVDSDYEDATRTRGKVSAFILHNFLVHISLINSNY